jgi:predicted branched-subunit amino acid permease
VAIAASIDRRALADMVPLAIPAVPFGLVVGLAMSESELPVVAGQSTSLLVFAGAAQLATVTLAGVASWWAVVLAVAVINARHVMYSSAVAGTFTHQPMWMRLFAPLMLVDQQFALVADRNDLDPVAFRRYYLSAGIAFWTIWQFNTAMGILIGPAIPTSLRLGFAPAIMFCGLVVSAVRNSAGARRAASATGAGAAAAVAAASVGLRDRLGILLGAVTGVVVATIVDSILSGRAADQGGGAQR